MSLDFKYFFQELIRLQIDDVDEILDHANEAIDLKKDQFENRVKELVDELENPKDKEDALERLSDEAFGVFERFPSAVWLTMAFSMYSFFEQKMNTICRQVRKSNAVKKVQVTGKHPVPAEKCLLEYGISLPLNTPEWGRLDFYRALRNRIAHHGGIVVDNDEESECIKKYSKIVENIEINDKNQIAVNYGFCKATVDDIRTILTCIAENLPDEVFAD